MIFPTFLLAALALGRFAPADAFDPGPNPQLLRNPTLSRTHIVFQYAGDLWQVPRAGGDAVRLTSASGVESNPRFSPDGKWVAFSGQYDGNTDVFVVAAEGGVPKRLTAHPAVDTVLGWSPDGKSVLFSSSMLSNTDNPRLFTVPARGGVPSALPFPSGIDGCFSPDGTQIAYTPIIRWQEAWKRYRGGQTSPVWIGALADSRVKSVPRKNTNDTHASWLGDSIYFLRDERGPVGLYRFDTKTGKVTEEVAGAGFDLKSLSAGPDALVYEKLGALYLFDPKARVSTRLAIAVRADFPEVRPAMKSVAGQIDGAAISPSGQRMALTARGWLFSVPASKGDARQLGSDQGIHRRSPAWSPDGRTVAFVTDVSGSQQLALYDLAAGTEKRLPLGDAPGVYDNLVYSPDSTRIAYTDNKLSLWTIEVATGKNVKVDTGSYRGPVSIDPRWSPDSRWLTWSRDLASHYTAVFVHEIATGKTGQITDGLAYAGLPCFDRDGKHLYFVASTDQGLSSDFEDMSQFLVPRTTSSVYAVVLRKDGENPLSPESDEEKAKPDEAPKPAETKPAETKPAETKPDTAKPGETAPAPADPKAPDSKGKVECRIDLDGIERRIIALPLPRRSYVALESASPGSLLILERGVDGPGAITRFAFSDRKPIVIVPSAGGFQVSADGSKLLVNSGGSMTIVGSGAPAAPGAGKVDVSGLMVKIDPRAEWTHMYHEVWQNERLLLYDPGAHGIDTAAMEKRYEPFLASISSRDDLNYLFTDMLGELCVGHMFIGGGDIPGAKGIAGGLLGADFVFENNRYKLTRIYDGERWNPGLYAPLAQPGINARVGEYVLAIDGQELTDATDIYEALEGKAGRQVRVKLGPTPDGIGSREAVVVPAASETSLRSRAWSEDNRRRVEAATGGRGGYVHVPDTGGGGWTEFNRYFYAQAGKDGLIVDERFNHGGLINDFMVNEMTKKLDFGSLTRYGHDWLIPSAAIYGPKVMLINEASGSGGDIFPFLFRQRKAGTLVGKRTWGAMISSYGFTLLDGGLVRAPDDAMYDPVTGNWVIENEGTPPDIDVELDPFLWRQGRDAQLEKAIEVLNAQLKDYKPVIRRPKFPDKSRL